MGKYTVSDRDFCFEQWYRMGQPGFTRLITVLTELKDTKVVDMESIPSIAVLNKWKKIDDWDGKAAYRDSLASEYIEQNTAKVRTQVINYLLKASRLQLEAQIAILESAKLNNLDVEEARNLLGDSVKLGSNGTSQVKQAFDLLSREQTSKQLEESALQDILNQIENSVDGGEAIREILNNKLSLIKSDNK